MYPPAQYTAYCHAADDNPAIGAEITRLNGLVLCERQGKDAIRAWEKTLMEKAQ